MRGSVLVLALLTGFVGESFFWIQIHNLPLDYMVMQQRFRLGYAPLPVLVSIPAPNGPYNIGEYDASFVQQYSSEVHQYLGVPNAKVIIDAPFTIGQTEVTYEQYDYYVWLQQRVGDSGTSFPNTAKGGRGLQPVVNVNWYEANAYAKWLGEQTNRTCRLPTEAEWEYAARANTTTAYPWDNEIGQNQANCDGCGSPWDNEQSAPVARFQPNAFGVYDTSGNVMEWVCSHWQKQFSGDEQRCIERNESEEHRVVRGGSWDLDPVGVRSAYREADDPYSRDRYIGFRVLCLSPIE